MPSTSVTTPARTRTEAEMARSYKYIRKAVGWLALIFPFLLLIGLPLLAALGLESNRAMRASISDFYYSDHLRDGFVGVLIAIGVFLVSYLGPEKNQALKHNDDFWSNVAGISMMGVALIPTTPDGQTITLAGRLHFGCAAVCFLTLAYFCLVLFTKTKIGVPMTAAKQKRNRVYRLCGYTILASLVLAVLYQLFGRSTALEAYHPIFWLEAVCVWAFSLSWLVKGEVLMRD